MKQDEVIVGIVLIVVGAILFFMGDSINNPFSNRGEILMLFGGILVIVGLIVSIAGATTEEKKTDVKCQICGIPKGDKHFYVVNKKDQKLIVCGKCVELYRNEIAMKNKEIKQTSHDESLNILKTRYAKGEITKEQYEQMRKDLE